MCTCCVCVTVYTLWLYGWWLHCSACHGGQPSTRTCKCPQPATISGISLTVTPFSIFISWNNPAAPDCDQCVYEYIVYYKYGSTSESITIQQTQFVLTDLQPGTSVLFILWPKCGDVLGNPEMAIKTTSKNQYCYMYINTWRLINIRYISSNRVLPQIEAGLIWRPGVIWLVYIHYVQK